ncbi:MAG: hypothetical protein GY839_01030 [candidate division Zixibacteria bacterium]|nr:hypothetical protein [candidate division Zixibacteria bacterium]
MERTNPYLNNIAFYLLMLFAIVLILSNALAEFMAALMLMIWIAQSLAYRRREWINYPLFKPIAALILYKIIVLIASGYRGNIGVPLEQITLPFLYFIVPTIVVTVERRWKIVWLFISGAIIAAGIGTIKYLVGNDKVATSTVSGCYTLSNYLIIILGFLMVAFVFSKQARDKIFLGLISIPLIAGLIFTFTRAGYLVGAFYIIILGIFKDRKLFIPVILIAASIYILSPSTVERLVQRFDISNKKQFYSHRDDVIDFAKTKINEVGFFGYGINSYPDLAKDSDNPRINDLVLKTWHNLYLEYLFDGGPFALVILFWIIFSQVRYSLARYRKTKDIKQKSFQLGILMLILAIIVIGMFADPLRDPIISMLFWVLLGLSII